MSETSGAVCDVERELPDLRTAHTYLGTDIDIDPDVVVGVVDLEDAHRDAVAPRSRVGLESSETSFPSPRTPPTPLRLCLSRSDCGSRRRSRGIATESRRRPGAPETAAVNA